MALDFPNSPNINDKYTVGETEYTWDGTKWKAAAIPLSAPDLASATLTGNNINGNRFKSETFTLSATASSEGLPASSRDVRILATPQVVANPLTDDVTAQGAVSYSDPVVMHSSSENNWSHIGWAGPPFNRYIAYATGGSNSYRWAWSTDGATWNQFVGPKGANTAYGINWCYRTVDQKIYVGSAGQNTVYNTISTLNQLLNFENDGQNWTTSRPHDNPSHRTGMLYDERHDRIVCYRGPWDVCNTYVTKLPFPSTLDDNGWVSCGGIGGAHVYGKAVLDNGTNSWYVGSTSPHNEATYNNAFCLDLSQATPSIQGLQTTRDSNGLTGSAYDPTRNRWYLNGWYVDGSTPAAGGTSMSNYTGWGQNIEPTAYTKSFSYFTWSDKLQALVVVGAVTPNNGDKSQACHWISTDGAATFTRYITPECVGIQSGWTYIHEGKSIDKFLLCAYSGDIAGKRFGSSVTLGGTANFPELTFASAQGFEDFSVGQTVTQGSNSGVILDINQYSSKMILSSSDTFTIGQPLEGAQSTFSRGYLNFDSNGNVTAITASDPGWIRMNGLGPWTITFPATLADGNDPDVILPSGSGIQATVRAISETNGFVGEDFAVSAEVIPTN